MLAREPRVQPPTLESYSDVPLYNTKAVVHQTGVPAPTLRAWERRYGILSPRRGENDYRLYSERDIATVSWLRERVDGGMTISQAIALLRSLEPARRRGRRTGNLPAAAPAAQPAPPAPRLAPADLGDALLGAFAELDAVAARRAIMQAMAVYSVDEVCLSLFTPVLHEVGRRWANGQAGVVVEHFAAALVRAQLENLYHIAAADQSGPLIFVGCAPSELHEIGSLMLALGLRRAGLRVVYLGQSVERESLVQTAQAMKPAAVVLSATLPTAAEALVLIAERLRQVIKPAPQFFVGGQGFATSPELAGRIAESYVPLNAFEAAQEIRKRLTR